MEPDNTTFIVTVLIVGIGGTTLTLGVLAAMMALLKAIFPFRAQTETSSGSGKQP